MIGALWTGISGLSSQQTALDNESNNIANVNTVGYKSSRISFADQMYQDSIGKGSKVLDAEKLYTQGNLKLTGVDYDMALSGDGFFTVADKSASGTSENFYTRAGNFRMGDNGTLQDAAGNEVQGWPMSAIDSDNDVTTTNPNVSIFTNDYTKLLTSKIVEHSTYVETITAKATDYAATAMSDSESVFSGAGLKTKSAKISDVEAAISDYSSWLQKLKETPDGTSATSVTQMSEINFKSQEGTTSGGLVKKEGDQIYVYINGNKISQNYISTTTDDALATADLNGSGSIDGDDHNIQASRIATYKALADKISEIPGLVAYMASESGGINDVLEESDTFSMSTKDVDMGKGIIQIKSLIPGEEFVISEVGEISGNSTIQGQFQTSVAASAGSGTGALESSRDALAKLITGKQQDVYKTTDLKFTYDPTAQAAFDAAQATYDAVETAAITAQTTFDNATTAVTTAQADLSAAQADLAAAQADLAAAQAAGDTAAENAANAAITAATNAESAATGAVSTAQTAETAAQTALTTAQTNLTTAAGPLATAQATFDVTGGVDNDYTFGITIFDKETGGNIPVPHNGATPPVAETIEINDVIDIDDFVEKFETAAAATNDPKLTDYIEVSNINGNLVIKTLDKNYEVDFSTDLKKAGAPLDKNNDLSGRAGAGAEFIEIVNTVNQTSSQDSLQLRLDTLGISDSAFGEFSVDSSGLITMTQDGAEFAIGQASIALFNNNIGLEARGDNLLAKTTDSGDPIYNLNNDKAATIEGQTLELSTADLSESLVNLMVFQRAFEANAKSITTADEILTTLIGLKR
ncbi:flagellar hook-basal body complex protein [Arcobacter peruensis]|uniref:flagellar hook-basal body complex protein n=1 Tax=Arcobacter peruensis TaxID=2320140 RepID=UPI0019D24D1F|nr:flagellar hook-basal body complex protein [Arcobacter peruensis]